jgi:predicted glycosyltransferase
MKIAFFLNTPAQVHLHKNVIRELQRNGHQTVILARAYGDTTQLLDELEFKYSVYLTAPKSKVGKILSFPFSALNAFYILRKENPDLIVDAGGYGALTSRLLGKPCLVFSDSEPMPVQLLMLRQLAYAIVTPDCFVRDLGRKHIRVRSYKELAYLHPDRFTPDGSIYALLGIKPTDDFSIVRFNAFDAVHDVGIKGLSLDDKRRLVERMSKYGRVFISSELDLPEDLSEYSMRIPKTRIHDALSFAKILIADTQTMTTEAAVLGTPVVRINSFVGENDMGNFIELEKKYGLIFNYSESDKAIEQAIQLAAQPNIKKEWIAKRDNMLKDKIDLTEFLVWLIRNFPASVAEAKGETQRIESAHFSKSTGVQSFVVDNR